MKGFFTRQDLSKLSPARLTGCASCGLAGGCFNPKMEPSGKGDKKILVIAEAPGEEEDKRGIQLIGKVGRKFRQTLRGFGIDLDEDCRKTNAVRCRPPDNETPTGDQVAACRHHIFEEIEKFKPKIIIVLGSSALTSLLGGRWKNDSNLTISRWRGYRIPDHELGAWICPTFHPSYVARNEYNAPAAEVIWKRDLQKALDLLGEPLPRKLTPDIHMLAENQVERYLLGLWQTSKGTSNRPYKGLKPGTPEWMSCWKKHPEFQDEMALIARGAVTVNLGLTIAFDYETTGLKPYKDEQEIVCCSIAESPEKVYAWMWTDTVKPMFREIMLSPLVRKIGAQNKFEDNWTRAKCGHGVVNWYWDVVLGGKTLDNRPGNAGVKFQSYARLGILDYNEYILPYIGSSNGSNGLNRMKEADPKKVMEYCGMDSALEYALCKVQRKEIGV